MRYPKPQMHMSFLSIGDLIVDVNNENNTIKGYGLGKIESIKNDFFYVKFESKKWLVMYNQFLFRHDTAGLKGSRRAYTLDEFIKNYNYGNFDNTFLEEDLLKEVLKQN